MWLRKRASSRMVAQVPWRAPDSVSEGLFALLRGWVTVIEQCSRVSLGSVVEPAKGGDSKLLSWRCKL